LQTKIWEKALSPQLYLLLICAGKLDKTNAAFDKVKEYSLLILTTTPNMALPRLGLFKSARRQRIPDDV